MTDSLKEILLIAITIALVTALLVTGAVSCQYIASHTETEVLH